MDLRSAVERFVRERARVTSREIARRFGVSRQYAHRMLRTLVDAGILVRQGSTRGAVYVRPGRGTSSSLVVHRRLQRKGLEEDIVPQDIWRRCPALLSGVPPNVRTAFSHGFLEMLNNAIEHSGSRWVEIDVMRGTSLAFTVRDFGVGVFRNVARTRKLRSEWEAIQDLLKGKTTTDPARHSGEGIFFTSKIADVFVLESFGLRLTADAVIGDVFVERVQKSLRGTEVRFRLDVRSTRRLADVFRRYQRDAGSYAFDKTNVRVRLFASPDAYLSRSQACRLLAGLERFRTIELDFSDVQAIGQSFADEIFRVFLRAHPGIEILPIRASDVVLFMIERARKERG